MFIPIEKSQNKVENYNRMVETLPYYINRKDPWYVTLANTSALIDYFLDRINWVGFYVWDRDRLYLGPFQGKPACTEIKLGLGVVGASALQRKPLIVKDVSAFEGHISCDQESQSEIVLPIVINDALFAVLDIDSPEMNRFDAEDLQGLEKLVRVLIDNLS